MKLIQAMLEYGDTLVSLGVGGVIGWFVKAWWDVRKERLREKRAAAREFRALFAIALGELEDARRHGTNPDRPQAGTFLQQNFKRHAEAYHVFRPFVSRLCRHAYDKAWDQYAGLARAGNVDPVFMAEGVFDDDKDPWGRLIGVIQRLLTFAK